MSYKEFVLLYTTLILGLACANIFYGLGQIIHEWKNIKFDWVYTLAASILFMTIVDFWFHAFFFPYEEAEGNIIIFSIFLLPPITLFFNTLILFPSSSNNCVDYMQFFQNNLRSNISSYGIFLFFTGMQLYITGFMIDIFLIPIIIYILICVIIYVTNSVKIYKVVVICGIIVNLIRWQLEEIYFR